MSPRAFLLIRARRPGRLIDSDLVSSAPSAGFGRFFVDEDKVIRVL
jgi:hypothetical protein